MTFLLQGIKYFFMRSITVLVILLGITGGEIYSQTENFRSWKKDTVLNNGIRQQINVKEYKGQNSYSFGIIQEFYNLQGEKAKSITDYYEERERKKAKDVEESWKRIEKERVRYYNEVMGLTESESEKFWPVYNEYAAKLNEILKTRQETLAKMTNPFLNFSKKERRNLLDTHKTVYREECSLREDYISKFNDILGDEKLMLYYRAEHIFTNYLLSLLRSY